MTSRFSTQWLRMLAMLAIATLLALLMTYFLSSAPMANAQGYPSQPLRIVVRDGVGTPLTGIALDLLITGPPHEQFDTCVTDTQGECRMMVSPGAYLVQFTMGWQGRSFVPSAQQNAGRFEDGGFGGFAVYLEPSSMEQIVTFVVGLRDNQLVPLWDLSRDSAAPPQPFAPSDDPLHPEQGLIGIDLGPLSEGAEPTGDTTQVIPAETAQVVISEFLLDAPTPQAQATAPVGANSVFTPIPNSQPLPASTFGPAMIALVVMFALAVVLMAGWKYLQNRRRTRRIGGANG